MQFSAFVTVLSALATFIPLSTGAALSSASSLASRGYAISTSPMKWIGPSKGVNITLYGNAEEIFQQLQELDPDWVPPVPPFNATARNTESAPGVNCCPVPGQPFHMVNWYNTDTAAARLWQIGGLCLQEDYYCGRVSCYSGSAVVLCASESWEVAPTCQSVAQYAWDIIDDCPANESQMSCGQKFSSDAWNVVIDSC